MAARVHGLEALGAVLIVQDAIGSDLCGTVPEFFALPPDVKRGLVSGHIGPRPDAAAYESVRAWETTKGSGVRNVGDLPLAARPQPCVLSRYEIFVTLLALPS